ncbi:Zn(2)-C6 fungal-type domain-containing protein [Mycena indigotica]|uniref:Zn(2)-C6 fungal-type domain-containing protein n=1 Tax=Mycena indigotica TaxID=2126181 RepID=A0A8H6T4W9_9AGAR|nr:Zn(2)-C6 fungal-type domain-containing protein [Mycena indigotica]KAF7312155.1 Zn(2)-C6 fungal-type domain-containing protein [Mycena indigotica]
MSSPTSPSTHNKRSPPDQMEVDGSSARNNGTTVDDSSSVAAPRKRKRNADNGDPRRLRRSHEACSRCRAKKIKCDSKHPRCTACANSGVVCAQEDRHRNTLTPRGHLERVEFQLAQSIILIRHLTGRIHFDLIDLDSCLVDAGLDPNPPPLNSFTYEPLANIYTTAFPPPEYYSHINNRAPDPEPEEPTPAPTPRATYAAPATDHVKGQDPNSNDLSSTHALAKNFGVSPDIVSAIAASQVDKEDLAVGSSGLTSGRDRSIHEAATPRDPAHWVTVTVRRGLNAFANPPHIATVIPDLSGAMDIWLPKDRAMVNAIVEVYFTRLNIHRPVFSRLDFFKSLDELYGSQISGSGENACPHDPGFLCSFYLVLALGTLSDLNNRSVLHQMDYPPSQQLLVKKLMPADWPEHDEFFERALSVKPDLRVTMSSLQALILLHWYLYTERQGRTLWRLVGSLVRLSVELGLHHDPTSQLNAVKQRVFTDEEALLRINLWGIILIHDRGTSILLGRPLGIAPSDSNTIRPSRSKGHNEFSEHFELSHAVAEIQADIINSLYSPTRNKGDGLMRNATRVIKSMSEFRRSLPKRYQNYFGGTEDWTMEQKTQLVRDIKEDEGLTLLKIGIARLLLLRALFSCTELHYEHRHKALIDAIVTAHNVIIFHSQLIRFPDIGFFTSPIPLHIAAMVILYGQMSNCDRLDRQTAIDDLWLALDMLPRFRWRWERKDLNGGHPLIFKLASSVMGVDLHTVKPTTQPVLLAEPDWDEDSGLPSPMSLSQHTSPAPSHAYPPKPPYSHQRAPVHDSTPTDGASGKHLVDIPTGLFYPFYPEENSNPAAPPTGPNTIKEPSYNHILAAAATHGQHGSYAGQGSYDTYISEERSPTRHRMHWENNNNHGTYVSSPRS